MRNETTSHSGRAGQVHAISAPDSVAATAATNATCPSIAFGDERLPPRFWAKVQSQADGCWQWNGAVRTSDGRAVFRVDGATHRAHRFAYLALVGMVPDGMQLGHVCCLRSCVNPAHLSTVSPTRAIERARSLRAEARAGATKIVDVEGFPFEVQRFHDRYRVAENECWEWTAYKSASGYGVHRLGGRIGKQIRAHRLSWILANGEIPVGMLVCHRCDNPPCVNPAHLFLGTDRDNTLDMVRKGRARFVNNGYARCKLSADQVREVIASPLSHVEMARRLGVCVAVVSGIRLGKSYRHITGGAA